MAGSLSDFLEKEVMDHVFGKATYTAPNTMYVALFTAAPADAGGGTECDYDAYARASYVNNTTNWGAATGTACNKVNAGAITFASNTGTSTDTAVAMGIYDASTAGNLLVWADLASSKAIGPSDIPKFNASAIAMTLT